MTESEAIKRIKECRNTPNFQPYIYMNEALNMAIKALEEVQKYRVIGTLEECGAAAVKQTAKKPIFNHNLSDTLSIFHCECGNKIKVSHDIGIMINNNAPIYCSKCGCWFDWSDEE